MNDTSITARLEIFFFEPKRALFFLLETLAMKGGIASLGMTFWRQLKQNPMGQMSSPPVKNCPLSLSLLFARNLKERLYAVL